ncbi:MAG: hypothetical protein DMF60_12000 [Acidobacteria bacterium]|nr:MAG: hypothetical protein DMF60_12000 [Acidobacteriota bacterium]
MISPHTTIRAAIVALATFLLIAVISFAGCKRSPVPAPASPSAIEPLDPFKEAFSKVEQDRGEVVGHKATVEIPEQLKHYGDRRRFLAVQAAAATTESISIDFADLAPLIQRGELVEMKPLGTDYILYGVGYSVSGEPFAHYDSATKQDIPLAATEEGLTQELQRASDAVKESAAQLAAIEADWRRAPRRDRARRATLSKQVAQARNSLALKKARNKLLTAFYADPKRRKFILAEHQLLSDLARDFNGEAYDLNDSSDRRRFKMRLLSFIRPQARDVLTEIAHQYKEKFDRPLPVSSLVRPVEYQRELAETNANASRGPSPPHSTGLAFDLFYKYMSAAEQEYLMSVIAPLKDEGRVEALRETRDNIHVYVFSNGQRPDEKLVVRAIAEDKARRPDKSGKKDKARRAGKSGKKKGKASRR